MVRRGKMFCVGLGEARRQGGGGESGWGWVGMRVGLSGHAWTTSEMRA